MNDPHDNAQDDKAMLARAIREADQRAHEIGEAGYPGWESLRPRGAVAAERERIRPGLNLKVRVTDNTVTIAFPWDGLQLTRNEWLWVRATVDDLLGAEP